MISRVEAFEQAKAMGWHSYGVVLKGKGQFAGGTSTAYASAANEAAARAKVLEHSDPDEEQATEVFLQTVKGGAFADGCPCILCDARRGSNL